MTGVITDAALQARIHALQAKSQAQAAETGRYFKARGERGQLSWDGLDEDANRYLADKLVALEPIKAEFCHMMCLALLARRVVEIGTSYGVSTLYLADAVRQNGGGVVVATEYEPAKAAAARESFNAAGVADLIDLREGDLRETLKTLEDPVDFVDGYLDGDGAAGDGTRGAAFEAGRRRRGGQHRRLLPRALPPLLRLCERPEEPPPHHDSSVPGRARNGGEGLGSGLPRNEPGETRAGRYSAWSRLDGSRWPCWSAWFCWPC